jgi:hypothetical protein
MQTDTTLSQREANAAYHADTDSLSNSMLKVFRESAKLFQGRFVTKTIPAPPATASLQLGTCVHALLFDDDPGDTFVKGLSLQRRSNADKEAWAAFEAKHAGKIVLDHDDHALAHAIAKSVWENDTAQMLLQSRGTCEMPVYSVDGARRCKPDKIVHDAGGALACIVDNKNVQDPSPEGFRRAVAYFGYHCQAAWYQDVIQDATGELLPFYFIVAGTKIPHDVGVYELDKEALAIGREVNRETVKRINQCRATGVWVNEWSKDIQTLMLPRWAMMGEYISGN